MTRHVHTNTAPPRQRAMSPHRYPIPSAFLCTQMSPRSGCKPRRTGSAATCSFTHLNAVDSERGQSGNGNVWKSKQLCPFSFFNRPRSFLRGHYLDLNYSAGRMGTGGGGLPKKSGGKEPDCFNLSACGAPLFIKLFGRVIQTQAPVFCAPPLFSHENQFPWRPSLIPVLASTMATCARPDRLRAGMMRLSALIPAHSGNGGPCHFVVPSAGLDRKTFAIIISCSAEAQPHYTPTRLLIRTDNQRD